ncbi:uncharacterized protein LOC131604257 [Vicia villosa]|uniref:uncharacterized protein LOC131604257 n=1 Tax=Vicia villosa TaxID=3911 RepID=UPI00273A8A80|nr:uncharacterized protein LOC131604257 [Vicia villosa]
MAMAMAMAASSSSSSIQVRSKKVAMLSTNVYLPDECWECIFKFLINHDADDTRGRYFHLKSLSIVSNQLLSVTNRLRSSLTIYYPTCQFFDRFSNISSLNLSSYYVGDLDDLLVQISFSLLSKCPCIQHLNLQRAYFLNNQHVAELSLFLGDLMSIDLSECKSLTESALFALVSNCPSLIEIKMEWTSIGKEIVRNSNSSMDCIVNSQLKSLYLAHCQELTDETIIRLSPILSNLQLLDLNSCRLISDESICQVLRRFCNIRHLNLANCSRVNLLVGMNFELLKLEVLNLSYTAVHDEALYAISKGCRGLLHLNLKNCHYVTCKGVKYVVENCTQLREINLQNCDKVHGNVSSMLLSSSSLRKIIAPPHIHFTRKTMKLFSHHGCRVC